MVKFKFFVHCSGWKDGGYYNTHFANDEGHAKEIIAQWNKKHNSCVEFVSATEITMEEFMEDYICE